MRSHRPIVNTRVPLRRAGGIVGAAFNPFEGKNRLRRRLPGAVLFLWRAAVSTWSQRDPRARLSQGTDASAKPAGPCPADSGRPWRRPLHKAPAAVVERDRASIGACRSGPQLTPVARFLELIHRRLQSLVTIRSAVGSGRCVGTFPTASRGRAWTSYPAQSDDGGGLPGEVLRRCSWAPGVLEG